MQSAVAVRFTGVCRSDKRLSYQGYYVRFYGLNEVERRGIEAIRILDGARWWRIAVTMQELGCSLREAYDLEKTEYIPKEKY